MRTILLLTALMLSLTATAQISVSRIKRQLETSNPQENQLNLRRGETVDLDMQFLSYGTVMDITGATVTLHATTNGMEAGTSFQISGTAGSNGTASVRISVEDWLPYQLTTGTWTLECAQANASRIMRASGIVKLSGLYYPSTNSPLPVSWSTNFWTEMAGKVSATDATYTSTVFKASIAFSWGSHAGLYRAFDWLPSWNDISGKPTIFPPSDHNQAWSSITNPPSTYTPSSHEHDAASITNPPWITAAQIPSYDNTKIVSLDSNYFVRISGTNLVLLVNSGNVEEYTITYGEDVLSGNLMPPLFPSGYTFPKDLVNPTTTVTDNGWTITVGESGSLNTRIDSDYPPSAWYVTLEPVGFPFSVQPQDGAYGSFFIYKTTGIFTNTVKTFASVADLQAAVATIDLSGVVSTNSAEFLAAVAHLSRTDNPHSVTAARVGAYSNTNPSNFVSASTVSNQIAQSSSANFVVRMTAAKTTAFTFSPTNATYVGDSSGSLLATNAVVALLAGNVGDYVLAVGDTNNTFTTVQGTYVNADIYAYENEAGDQQYKLEIYRRDLETDVMSEWGDGGPPFTIPASMGKTSISIYVPSVSTNAFRVCARLKRMGGNATSARNLYIGTGTGTPTFFSLTIPASVPIDVHNASALAHPTMIRSSLTWTAAGTNATYRMYWDITNGTFAVQEILP